MLDLVKLSEKLRAAGTPAEREDSDNPILAQSPLKDTPPPSLAEDADINEPGLLVRFQHEPGGAGTTIERLIDVAISRLDYHQCGDVPCEENLTAILHLQTAKVALEERTRRRQAQGVEGTLELHQSAG